MLPDRPYKKAMPYSKNAEATEPMMKYFMPASTEACEVRLIATST